MSPAQAAEVLAGGGAAAGVRDDVVEVGPAGGVGAAGPATRPVPGAHEPVLPGRGPVAVDRPGSVQDRAGAVTGGVVGAAAAGQRASNWARGSTARSRPDTG